MSRRSQKGLTEDQRLVGLNECTSSMDAIIEIYKKDVDMTLIRENLKLTVEERLIKLQNFVEFLEDMRRAGEALRRERDRQ